MYFRAVKLNLRNQVNVFNIFYNFSTKFAKFHTSTVSFFYFNKLLEIIGLIQWLFESTNSHSF